MRKTFFSLSLITALIVIFTFPVFAEEGSLYSEESGEIYSDRPEYEEGDIITIDIEEDSNAIQSANTSTSQSSEVEAEGGTGLFDFLQGLGFGYSDSGDSDGETERSGTLEADITTEITRILDTGNYRIEGTKNIKINGEDQEVKLSGVIRPEDVSLDNSVDSEKIADVDIEYSGRGVVADKQRASLLERLFNWIF
ncbi:MAG: flagellar basal body L-ring protein FlgH [Halanaerobiaceae bacterium]